MEVAAMFLSPLLELLFDKLASRVLLEFSTRRGIRSRIDKLKENLDMISQVITHAENMVVRQKGVDEWLEEFRDWAYDADDFLDEVNTRAMQEEEEEARRSNTYIQRCCTLEIVRKVRDLGSRIHPGKYSKSVDELNSRLDTISERMRKMHNLMKMIATDNTPTPPTKLQRPLEATANEFDARVFGREQEKERINEQLKSSGDADVEVIPIVGMPGIGKTTLARHVFNSVQQQQQPPPPLFDIKGWVCVSDDFDVNRITRDILESFTSRASDLSGLNQLQSELKDVVGGKRFLLVLDDVWSRNYFDDWAPLRSPFGVGAPGSKILVTTRDERVASMMQTDDPMKIHRLGTLCDDDCWSVFLQHVVDKRNSVFELEAGRFRMKILDKCKGLPLTAKLLAGLLRGESPGQGWEAKLDSSIWDIEFSGRKGYGMPPVVMLSYFHLPQHLKRCFSYCSVLPEDYEFGEEEVVMMWVAQGLVLPEGVEQVEVIGAKYFGELVSRSLFQPSPNYRSRFLMHDLINDMAEIVAGNSCFKFGGDPKIESNPTQARARYSSYRRFRGLKMEFEAFERAKYLRAFQSFGYRGADSLTSYVPLELLMKLKYLRVLRLSNYCVRELPEDIGDLIHLRLVDLSDTYITELPESTSRLYNLLALELEGCWRLTKLPTQMRKLVNLRNLNCSWPNKLVAMPVGMGKLTSLQKLSNFIVGEGLEQGIDQLKGLSHLKGSISISFLENVHDSKEAKEAKLMSKEGLQSIELRWKPDHGDLQGTDVSFHVFQELQPHKHLEKLIIDGYGGLWFPGWVGDDSFSKMRVIQLANCGKCTSLPPLGKLPILEEVQIRNMGGIERVGEEFYGKERGAFPSLRILKFEGMENWSIWLHPTGGGCRFACLQELHVINCPKLLMSLPDGINVQKLEVRKCDKLELECLKGDGDASQLLPSVTSLNIVEAPHQMTMLGSLTALEIESIPELTHLPEVVLQRLPKLEKLSISRCEKLTSLWKMEDIGRLILQKQKSHFLNSLRVLEVEECYRLDCLVPQQCLGLPCGLETLRLRKCDELEKLPSDMHNLTSLSELVISDCDKLEKLPSDMHNLTSLRKLQISSCKRLSCLPEISFPSNLESLFIWGCDLLTCLSVSPSSSPSSSMGGHGKPLPHSLEHLNILGCKNLESLISPALTSADSFPSLQSLQIHDCPKLKSLPDCIHRRLKHLMIAGCQNLLSISVHYLPALEHLGISGWPAGLFSIQQGGPNSLPSNLQALHIEGVAGTMTPNDEQLFSVPLPSSLTSLRISKFKNLSPEAFQNLTSLEELYISDCPEFTSIPDQLLPPSLLSLHISGCPGLISIPDQLLPPSLLSLSISACPLLAPYFAKGKGRYWPKVKFIPDVEIDYRSIFDPKEVE